jgi:putative aldouronate transport system permease protein
VLLAAQSALDIALYDIVGKALGVPVYELLGGKHRDTIPCFATTPGGSGEQMLAWMRLLWEHGWRVIRTTLVISVYSLVVGFPIPILLAFMINEVRSTVFKKTVQMVSYAPYFISTVALCGMLLLFLKKDTGFINALIALFGGERADLISNPSAFSSIYVWSGIWQTMGWSSIIYIAALSAVNPEIVEAAVIDGVTRFQKIIHVDLPTILPTVVILLILSAGSILGVGSEKVLLLQNSLNMEASDVISTYTYRLGILERQYGYTTAIGLLNSVINALVLVLVNTMARRLGETSLW